jgi:hypothetical protein
LSFKASPDNKSETYLKNTQHEKGLAGKCENLSTNLSAKKKREMSLL